MGPTPWAKDHLPASTARQGASCASQHKAVKERVLHLANVRGRCFISFKGHRLPPVAQRLRTGVLVMPGPMRSEDTMQQAVRSWPLGCARTLTKSARSMHLRARSKPIIQPLHEELALEDLNACTALTSKSMTENQANLVGQLQVRHAHGLPTAYATAARRDNGQHYRGSF